VIPSRPTRGWLERLLDVVFPRSCLACGEPPDRSPLDHLCQPCLGTLEPIRGARCPRCGSPRPPEACGRDCADCQHLARDLPWEEGRSLFRHRGASRSLLVALKYHHARFVRHDFARLLPLFPDLGAWIGPSVIVPVPMLPHRERARGYNQARECARLLARLHPGATVAEPLARILDTPSQTRLNRTLRSRNVLHAFALRPHFRLAGDRPHLLVDDVFTTGATLHACAVALRAGGVRSLRVLTWAHG